MNNSIRTIFYLHAGYLFYWPNHETSPLFLCMGIRCAKDLSFTRANEDENLKMKFTLYF